MGRVLEREAAPGGRVMTRAHDGIEYELGASLPPAPTASDAPSIAIHQGGRRGRGAQTTRAQGQLQLESDRGQLAIARGPLNAALGIPVHTRITIRPPDGAPDPTRVGASVDHLLEAARRARPDVAAARSSTPRSRRSAASATRCSPAGRMTPPSP